MNHHKLEKHLQLYRQQYEDFMMQLYGSYKIDRASMDLDAIMFRIKYMKNHNKDLDKLNIFRNKFEEQAYYTRNLFINLIYNFLSKIIGNSQPIKDIFITDIKMDQNYIDFDLQIISEDKEYLEWLDKKIPDNETFNMFPDKYFRFNTDSYNDGIAKAYPELFENREQNVVGTGDDKDIFVHSMTFQSGERCSLSCFPEGTDIMMADFTHKDISKIEIGDKVIGFEEFNEFRKQRTNKVAEVTAISSHYESCFKISHPFFKKDLYVTPQHPFLTSRGEWVEAKDLRPSDGLVITTINPYQYYNTDISSIEYITGYFLGGWLGDGTCTTGPYRTAYQSFRDYYHTRFVTKDHEMNERIYEYSKILGFDMHLLKFKISTKYDITVEDAVYSGKKETFDKFWKLVEDSFNNKELMNNPNFLMGFSAGFMDAEGSIQGLTIRIINTNMKLLKIIEKTLSFLNIKYTYDKIRDGVNYPVYTLRTIGGISENIKFLSSIKNVIPRKMPEHYIGTSTFRTLMGYKIEYVRDAMKVYNFETTTHTYIANRLLVHNCTYCLSGDSLIQTPNGYPTRIKNLKEGDLVYGFDENTYLKSDFNGMVHHALKEVKVIKTYKHEAEVWELKSPYILYTLKITPNHKILTIDGWKELKHIKPGTMLGFRKGQNIIFSSNYQIYKSNSKIDVYNIATESGTYIANGLCVHNCYQFAKSEMRMSFDTAKEFIDHLLNDDYGYINRYNSPAIILEFIGGEPLLEIKLTRKIYEYFLERCYELNHPWFTMHRLSICSNGLQYFDKEVQDFFEEYSSQISFNISIDGNKELHDACRVQPNGEGSYDIDMMALNHYNKYYTAERNSKMTLAPSNISYLFDSVVDFIKHGMSVININCVFEEGWEPSHALIEYEQLKKLADYILENDLEHIYVAIFNERQEDMMDKHSDNTACGGSSASMLSIRPNGEFYPCIRYMPTSVGLNRRNMSMGSVSTGMIERSDKSEVIRDLDHTTRRGYSTDICFECPLSNDCMNCGALSVTVFNSVNRRTTFACIMMIAEHLANVYYWNAMILKHPEWDLHVRRIVVPDEWALLVIDKDELDFLKKLETLAMMNVMER